MNKEFWRLNNEILQLLTSSKVMKIMKSVKTLKTVSQITKETGIPITIVYRLVAKLEKNQYLKSVVIQQKVQRGRKTKKYCRGKNYQITITPGKSEIIWNEIL